VLHLDDRKVRAASDPAARARQGVSLVAFHGAPKPPGLRELVEGIAGKVGSALRDHPGLFRPYPLAQVHATLVGLEATRETGVLANANARARQRDFGVPAPPLDLAGLFEELRRQTWPLPVRFGGHAPAARNPHDARGPWERAFDVRDDGLAVLIGWPRDFAPSLLDLRKRAERHGVVHKYHVDPMARDNDLFLVLGGVDARALEALGDRPSVLDALERARAEVRGWLERKPVDVELEVRDLSVVAYRSTTLEVVSAAWPLGAVDAADVLEHLAPTP
jgi:hypothetical protein